MSYFIQIASVPDREQVVSEIWYNNHMIAEINQEGPRLALELYQTPEPLELTEFLKTMQKAADGLRKDWRVLGDQSQENILEV